jgi:hypothetical protein
MDPCKHLCGSEAALAHHEDQVRVLPPDGQRVSIPSLKGVSHIRNGLAIFRIKSRVELISIDCLHVHIAGLAEQRGKNRRRRNRQGRQRLMESPSR